MLTRGSSWYDLVMHRIFGVEATAQGYDLPQLHVRHLRGIQRPIQRST